MSVESATVYQVGDVAIVKADGVVHLERPPQRSSEFSPLGFGVRWFHE